MNCPIIPLTQAQWCQGLILLRGWWCWGNWVMNFLKLRAAFISGWSSVLCNLTITLMNHCTLLLLICTTKYIVTNVWYKDRMRVENVQILREFPATIQHVPNCNIYYQKACMWQIYRTIWLYSGQILIRNKTQVWWKRLLQSRS